MASPDAREVSQGLSKLAHAVRRSTALNVATLICEPGTSMEELFATADRCALWIGGQAAQAEADTPRWTPPTD